MNSAWAAILRDELLVGLQAGFGHGVIVGLLAGSIVLFILWAIQKMLTVE